MKMERNEDEKDTDLIIEKQATYSEEELQKVLIYPPKARIEGLEGACYSSKVNHQ
jgi:hypothetical protein